MVTKHLTQEHKDKIGRAVSIANKGKHNSPATEFKIGRKSERKGKPFPQIRGENHYKWTGGTRATARRMAIRYGFNMNSCMSCGKSGKMVVHHVDENYRNNNINNLRILCFVCHRAVHGFGIETQFKKGHIVSKSIRMKISKANKGKTAWNKGLIGVKR